MDKNKALQLWEEKYGSREFVYDYAAQKIVKEDFEEESSSYSWTIDFIKPLTSGGFNQSSNMMMCSVLTKKLRQDKSTFRIGNALFEVRKGKKFGTFALYDVTDRNHPFDVSTVTEETLKDEYHTKRQIDLYGREKKESFVLPDLGNIRKNVFDEHAPDIISEEREVALEPVVEQHIEEAKTVVSINETTPVVEEKDESPVVEEVVEEKAPEIIDVPEVKEEEKTVADMVLLSDEEEPLIDERDVLFDTMNKEREYADDLRSLYHASLAKDEKNEQTILTLFSNCNALKENLNALRDKIVSMQSTIDEYKNEKDKLELSKNEEAKSQNDVIQSLNQENASLKSDLGKQYNDYEQLEAKYQEIYAKCASLEQEKLEWDNVKESDAHKDELLSEKDKEKDQLNNQISQLNLLIQEKTTAIDSLQSQLAGCKESFRVKSEEFDTLNANYNELISLKEDNEKVLTDKESEKSLLEKEKIDLQSRINSLLAEKAMEDERFRNVSAENDELRNQLKKEKEESDKVLSEKDEECLRLGQQYEDLKKEKENLSASLIAASAEKESILAEKESNYDKAVQLNVKLNESQATVERLTSENDDLKKELEENDNAHKEAIEALMKQKAEADGKIIFITCGGDIEHYSDYLFYLSDTDKLNTKETVLEALSLYPSWHRKDEQHVSALIEGEEEIGANVSLLEERDVSYLASEKENREKAMSYWASKYGDIDQTTDFAGRIINRNHYLDKEDTQGWNYIKIKSDDREYVGNILIANMRTLLDYKENGGFKSNGQSFKVVEENGVYSVESEDYVTDPYNLVKTLRVTKENLTKKSPIIYIFVKVLGSTTTRPDDTKLLEFYDLIDRTVRRTCSRSFIEMKTVTGNANYAFLTFDGSIDGAYKEALDYALLLNSYRNEMRKDENGINAVIILNQVEIPYSYRHFGFDQMLVLTKDLEMRALNYEFIQTAITNSMIKRAVHLGPSIIDNLPIDQSTLKESSIGQARSFSDVYNFRDKFYIYNYVFSLKNDVEEEK